MRQFRSWMAFAAVAVLIPALAHAESGPTRVRDSYADRSPPTRPTDLGRPAAIQPVAAAYDYPSSLATPEIISRVGEILGAIDNPEKRNQLAEQWLQYSKQVIAKDQEFRDNWLELQRQQLAQQQQGEQLRLEIAQLQARIEELRAQNLRLEQENLQRQQQWSQRGDGQVPRASRQTPGAR